MKESLINLPNFPAVARWSRIKDQQMNRLVDGGKKEEGGNARIHVSWRKALYPTDHESVIATYHGPTIRACTLWQGFYSFHVVDMAKRSLNFRRSSCV